MKFTDKKSIKFFKAKISWKSLFLARFGFLIIGIFGFLFPLSIVLQIFEFFRVNNYGKTLKEFSEMCDNFTHMDDL